MTEARRLLERVTRMAYRVGSDEETLINEVEAYLAQPMTTCEDVAAREAVLMGALRELRESVHSHSGLGDRHTHDPDTCPVYSEQGCWYCQRAPCRYICPKIDAALAGTSPAAAALLARERELVAALEPKEERIARLAWLVNELRAHIEIDGHGPYAIPAHPSGCHFCHALTRTIEDAPRAALAKGKKD